MLAVSKGGHCEPPTRGIRAEIQGFSDDSRRRLLYTIGKVRRDADLPWFNTLTWPESFPDPRAAKSQLAAFHRKLKRAFPGVGLIWKLEPQERGAPHFHELIWGAGPELRVWVPMSWYEIAGGGDWKHYLFHAGCFPPYRHCIERVRSWRGVWAYAAKYLGKTFEITGWDWPGRFWAVVNRHNIPFGKEMHQEITRSNAVQVQRYQRRFSQRRSRGRTMTTFCDADQWVSRLINAAPPGTMGIGDQEEQH